MTQSEDIIEKEIYVTECDEASSRFELLKKECLAHGINLKSTKQNTDTRLHLLKEGLFLVSDGQTSHYNWPLELKNHLKKNYSLAQEPLAKALGIHKKNSISNFPPIILDATLGTGKDSILLLSFGAHVIACERNVEVFIMGLNSLLEVWELAKSQSEYSPFLNFEIHFGGAPKILNKLSPDVLANMCAIYFDPMYPEKKKSSSLPRKEMQMFHKIVGPDHDFSDVLNSLTDFGLKVVLKRPIKSEKIGKPSSQFLGKTTRYDLYLKPKKEVTQ